MAPLKIWCEIAEVDVQIVSCMRSFLGLGSLHSQLTFMGLFQQAYEDVLNCLLLHISTHCWLLYCRGCTMSRLFIPSFWGRDHIRATGDK
jgi:hypothetical protein